MLRVRSTPLGGGDARSRACRRPGDARFPAGRRRPPRSCRRRRRPPPGPARRARGAPPPTTTPRARRRPGRPRAGSEEPQRRSVPAGHRRRFAVGSRPEGWVVPGRWRGWALRAGVLIVSAALTGAVVLALGSRGDLETAG